MTAPTIVNPHYAPPTESLIPRSASSVTDLVVHHSASPKDQTVLEIDAFERANGDAMMPYTYLIDDAGVIYSGRPALTVSAASFGRNRESIAVCLIGNFQRSDSGFNGPPSQAALTSLYDLILWLHLQFPSINRTYPHGCIADLFFDGDPGYATECAGDQLDEKLMDPGGIKSRVAAVLQRH